MFMSILIKFDILLNFSYLLSNLDLTNSSLYIFFFFMFTSILIKFDILLNFSYLLSNLDLTNSSLYIFLFFCL